MTKSKLLICFLFTIFLLSFTSKETDNSVSKTGYIYKVKLNINENLMERSLVKNPDNSIHLFPITKKRIIVGYKTLFIDKVDEKTLEKQKLDTPNNGPSYEMLDEKETNNLLTDLSDVLVAHTGSESVKFLKKSKSGKILSMFGNVASNALGKNKLSFSLPSKKLKRIKFKADEYYEIKMDFIWGGEAGTYTVMNKEKGENFIKFKVNVTIIASNKKGHVQWKKEKEIKDFTSIFSTTDILEDKKGKYFKLKRAPRKFNSWNKEPIGDFHSLSTKEFKNCINFSLKEALNE